MLELSAAGHSDVGFVRVRNEDAWWAGRRVLVVADGLGGHPAGDQAAQLAVQPVAAVDDDGPADPQALRQALAEAVRVANTRIREAGAAEPLHAGMGTTLTSVGLAADTAVLAHVGDSRAYLLRDGQLRQLTEDHDLAAEALRAGRLSAEEAARVPDRHVLTRAVGLEPEVAVDSPEPVRLYAGDRLLLCTDGLSGVLDEATIAGLLADGAPHEACERLVAATVERGAPDNVTVVVADVREPR